MRTLRTNRIFLLTLALLTALVAGPVFAQDDAAEAAPEPLWTTALGLSYVGTSGNTDTSSLGLDFKTERRPTPWGLNLVATFTRAEDNGEITAEQYLVGGRATRSLTDHWSLFAGASWAKDTFAGFESRIPIEAGVEYLAVSSDKHTLSFDMGLSWTTEDRIHDFDTPTEYTESVDWFGGVAGLKWEWAFSENASLSERLVFYPNFDDSDDWQAASDTAVTANLTDLMALQFSYLIRHRNQPIDNNEETDTTTKVSVVFSF